MKTIRLILIAMGLFTACASIAMGGELTLQPDTPVKIFLLKDSDAPAWEFMKAEIDSILAEIGWTAAVVFDKPGQVDAPHLVIGKITHPEIRPVFQQHFKPDDIAWDGFFVKAVGSRVFIGATSERGLVNGLHDFLERNFGLVWVRPWSRGHPRLKGPVRLAHSAYASKPAFWLRGMHPASYNGLSQPFARWSSRNKINHIRVGVRLYNHDNRSARLRRQAFIVNATGHSLYFWLPSKYYQEHPEYYALINGERRWYFKFEKQNAKHNKHAAKSAQLCMSNPEVVKVVAQNIKAFLRENPECEMIPLGQNDGGGWCECEKCKLMDTAEERKKGRYSTRYVKWVNLVAAEVCPEFPHLKIGIYAYLRTLEPPRVKPHPNIVVSFCTYRRCYKYPLDDPSSRTNREFNQHLKGWAAFGNHILIYDYLDFGGLPPFPVPMLRNLQANLQYYKKLGVRGYFPELVPDGYPQGATGFDAKPYYSTSAPRMFDYWTGMKINFYLVTKLLWDPDQDLDKLVNGYFHGYFGQAGGPLHELYRWMEERWYADQAPYIWNKWNTNFPAIIFENDAGVERAQAWLAQAVALAEKEGELLFRERVKREQDLAERIWFKEYNLLAAKRIPIARFTGKEPDLDSVKAFAVRQGSTASGFVRRKKGGTAPAQRETRVYAAYSNTHLLLAVECFEKKEKLVSKKFERDGKIWTGDTVELFIRSGPLHAAESGYYHFITNPDGSLYDARIRFASWNSSAIVSTRVRDDRWEALFQIPLKDIGYPAPRPGMKLRLNVGRNARSISEVSSWTDGSFHNMYSCGTLEVK